MLFLGFFGFSRIQGVIKNDIIEENVKEGLFIFHNCIKNYDNGSIVETFITLFSFCLPLKYFNVFVTFWSWKKALSNMYVWLGDEQAIFSSSLIWQVIWMALGTAIKWKWANVLWENIFDPAVVRPICCRRVVPLFSLGVSEWWIYPREENQQVPSNLRNRLQSRPRIQPKNTCTQPILLLKMQLWPLMSVWWSVV